MIFLHFKYIEVHNNIYVLLFVSGVAFRGLPDTALFPSVSAVYGNTEVSMVYLGPPLDG